MQVADGSDFTAERGASTARGGGKSSGQITDVRVRQKHEYTDREGRRHLRDRKRRNIEQQRQTDECKT